MLNLRNPKWLFLIHTLPVTVLFFLLFSQFDLIKTLLNDEQKQLWICFLAGLAILGLINASYAAYCSYKRLQISLFYSIWTLLSHIVFIYLYGYHLTTMVPAAIPQWMLSDAVVLYVGTFLMPSLAFAMLVLVCQLTPQSRQRRPGLNFAMALAVPLGGYLFSQVTLPLWKTFDRQFEMHAVLVLIIASTVVFFFFLVRALFILAVTKDRPSRIHPLIWKIPVALLLPLLGLLINNGHVLKQFYLGNLAGVFGNFDSFWFYTLTALNGILLCLPTLTNKWYRLAFFLAKSITFTFSVYFFLVFLPFLPLAVVAIIAVGIGFLLLSPLLVFALHCSTLLKEYALLKSQFSKSALLSSFAAAVLLIPLAVTLKYSRDKSVLNQALEYVYTPDYTKPYRIDTTSLNATLDVIVHHKIRNRNSLFGNQIPYLSTYFNWLVLDNLSLSESKLNQLKSVFLGYDLYALYGEEIENEGVELTDLQSHSVYDPVQKQWTSWVNLELTNNSENNWFSQYATTLDLPEGCWISDYYLYVGDHREMGILAEKKSAMWIFSNIRSENKDPGILYYLSGNKVALRVFPFSQAEVRKTGIELIHREPVSLSIDGRRVQLGDAREVLDQSIETPNAVYIPAGLKESLPVVQRQPYLHFMIDVSRAQQPKINEFSQRVEQLLAQIPMAAEHAKISLVNTYTQTYSADEDWQSAYKNHTFQGGYYLDRAVKTHFLQTDKSESYPVIVAITDQIENAIIDKDFADLKFAFPEGSHFFVMTKDGTLNRHSLVDHPHEIQMQRAAINLDQSVLQYNIGPNSKVYLADDQQASIVLKEVELTAEAAEIKEKNWQTALVLHGHWMSQNLQPKTADEQWLNLIRNSFKARIMTPVTSYLVVENEAQKAALKKKQQQALAGNKSLDLHDDAQSMSEPSWWLLALLFGLFVWYKRRVNEV